MANLKFYKGTEEQIKVKVDSGQIAAGAIWFNTADKTINVRVANGWEKYAGNLKDAAWNSEKSTLTINKYDGSHIDLDFSDMASASNLATIIGTFGDAAANTNAASIHARINQAFADIQTLNTNKLNAADQVVKSVDTTADAGVALVHGADGKLALEVSEGAVAENNASVVLGGQVHTAIEAAKSDLAGQISGKNVGASGDAYVSAVAKNNVVTVAATDATKASLALADSAVQKVTVLGQELINGSELTVGTAKTALGLESAAYVTVESLNQTAQDKVDAAVEALEDAIEAVAADAKTYNVVKLTANEVTALGDANVKDAYKLVQTVGEASTTAGDIIKIYKDSALQEVKLEGQELQFTYLLASGETQTVGVDVSAFLAESEFADGLQVVDHIVKVKLVEGSEAFLSVDANGLKLSGVQAAINKAEDNAKSHANGLKQTIDGTIAGLEGRIIDLEAKNETIDSALQADDITTGTANGTIAVKGEDVAVKGLGSAAYTQADAYATADQGAKADTAVQTVAPGSANGTIAVDGKDVAVTGLKSAAYAEATAFDAAGSAAAAQAAAIAAVSGVDADTMDSKTIEGTRKYAAHLVSEGLSWAMFD